MNSFMALNIYCLIAQRVILIYNATCNTREGLPLPALSGLISLAGSFGRIQSLLKGNLLLFLIIISLIIINIGQFFLNVFLIIFCFLWLTFCVGGLYFLAPGGI